MSKDPLAMKVFSAGDIYLSFYNLGLCLGGGLKLPVVENWDMYHACSVVGKRARAAHVILCVGTGSSLAAATDFYVASTHRARHPGRFKWVTAQ